MTTYDRSIVKLAIDLMNTFDPYFDDPERLATPDAAGEFLLAHDLPTDPPLTDGELADIHRLRGKLREIVQAEDDVAALRKLNALLETVEVAPGTALDEEGRWQIALTPAAGLPSNRRLATGAILGLAEILQRHGRDRLNICAADPCREVFIDLSRNRSRRYCSDRCANRHNVAAFRERARSTE